MCKISVVIPYYNSEKTILRALNSVISQTYQDYEIILINDGSTDDSKKIVNSFIENNRQVKIKNINQSNKGPSTARNLGVQVAVGEYIAFLDSDDEWEIYKLNEQMKEIKLYSCDMLGCNCGYITDKKLEIKYFTKKKILKISFMKMLLKHYFNTSSVIIRRDIFLEVGGFKEEQRYMEDSLLYTMISRNYNALVSNKVLVKCYKYPFGDTGLSSMLDEMEWNELENFKKLRSENNFYDKKINLAFYVFIVCCSILKYLRRKVIVILRNLVQ